jgi:hypothetical protein
MLIAGCSGGGGHSAGSLAPGGPNNTNSLVNGAKVTLSITLAQKQTLSGRRISNKARPAAPSKRVPSFVSPSTASVALTEMYNGASVFTTSVYLSQCTNVYVAYQCATNLAVGTYTIYANLYDSSNHWLGTNLYANPSPQTIYANGAAPSVYSNYLSVDSQAIAQYVFLAAPENCVTTNSGTSAAPIYVFDAAGNEIIGPLANPISGYVTAVNGGGQGTFDLYTASTYGTGSADNQIINDTSVYQPFVNVGSTEGSVFLYGLAYNIPALFGEGSVGAGGFQAGSVASPAYTQLTQSTYLGIAMTPGSPMVNVYAIEENVPAIEGCNEATLYGLSSPSLIGSVVDSTSGKEIVLVDGQNVDIVGGSGSPVFSIYGGVPQLYLPVTTYTLGSNETPVNLFTSPDVQGRFFVVTNNSNNSGNGQADQFLATSGNTVYSGSYQFQFPATSTTRIAGTSNGMYALYYSSGSNNLLYGVDRITGSQYPTLTPFVGGGYVYTVSPSGPNANYIFFRGWDPSTSHYELCSFDANIGMGTETCSNLGGSSNSNPVSVKLDTGSGDIMAVAGLAILGGTADVSPGSFSLMTLYSGFPVFQSRFTPGEATPGFIGVYNGGTTPYTTTFLQDVGGTWVSYGSVQWPNAWIVGVK